MGVGGRAAASGKLEMWRKLKLEGWLEAGWGQIRCEAVVVVRVRERYQNDGLGEGSACAKFEGVGSNFRRDIGF